MDDREFAYRSLKFMVIATIISTIVLLLLLGFWSLYPYKPMEVSPQPFPVVYPDSKVVKQGDYISYEFDYVKTSHVDPVIQRQFIDGLVFNVEGTTNATVTEPGCGTARVQVKIPETLPPGKYQLRVSSTYQMNPIRQMHFTYVTEEFEVISGRHTDLEQDTVIENAEDR